MVGDFWRAGVGLLLSQESLDLLYQYMFSSSIYASRWPSCLSVFLSR
jgi:hypothetical protein